MSKEMFVGKTGEEFWCNFADALESDDEPTCKKGRKILHMFKNSNQNQRDEMDKIFIAMCGYSITTLGGVEWREQ